MLHTALHFLQTHPEVAFATCRQGLPQVRLFQIMRVEDTTLCFATSPRKEVYAQLRQCPQVELLAAADGVSVRCGGTVSFDVDEATCRWIYDHNPVLPRLYASFDQLAYFRLPIERLDYFDLRPTPPVMQHFDLLSGTVSGGFVGERFGTSQPLA